MRILISIIAMLGLSAPLYAGHAAGTPPGQAADGGVDRNDDGRTNGRDYAPGKSAQEDEAQDINEDGKTNGKDYAPGQFK